ncbi:MAG: GAF domain-containing protein [Gemmatimonadota bacterium]
MSSSSDARTRVAADPLAGLDEAHLRTLIGLSQEFNATLDLEDLLPRILAPVLELLGAEMGSIWALDGETLRCLMSAGEIGPALVGIELPLGAGLVGDAALNRRPVLVTDASEDPRYLPQLDDATGFATGSAMAVPLEVRGELVGGLTVANRRGDGDLFEDRHLAFLTALGDDAAAALRNARMLEAERRARDLHALLDFSHQVAGTFDLDRIRLSIVNLGGEAIPYERCVLGVWSGERLQVAAISGEPTVDRRAVAVKELETFLEWVGERGEDLRVPDVADPAEASATRLRERFGEYLERNEVRGLLSLAIGDAEGRLGVLLFEFAEPRAFTEWHEEAAGLLAASATLALRNAQLYAGVPFISFLEPLGRKRRELARLPRATLLKYGAIAAVILIALTVIRLPVRVAAREATVRAVLQGPARAQVGGVIDRVVAEEGETVAPGDPIVFLRSEDRQRDLLTAEGDLAVARRQALAAEAGNDALGASLARVRATEASQTLAVLRRQEEWSTVRASNGGIVLTPRMNERVGVRVAVGEPVAWVGDPDWMEAELEINQADIALVDLDDRVRLRVGAYPSVTYEGTVTAVAPRVDPLAEAGTFTVRAVLDNRAGLLRPGMDARAKVLTESRPLWVVLFRRPWRGARMGLWWWLPL